MFKIGCVGLGLLGVIATSFGMPSGVDRAEMRRQVAPLKIAVKSFIESLEDRLEVLEHIVVPSNLNLGQTITALRNGIEGTNRVFARLKDLEKGRLTPLIVLEKMLFNRLENLEKRAENITTIKALPAGTTAYYGKTAPQFYETLRPLEQDFATLTTDAYQTNNLIIEKLYHLAGPVKIRQSHACQQMIAASPALWDLLQGNTQDLGHPDQAIMDDAWDRFLPNGDLALFRAHIPDLTVMQRQKPGTSGYTKPVLPLPAFLHPSPQPKALPAPDAPSKGTLRKGKKKPVKKQPLNINTEPTQPVVEVKAEEIQTPLAVTAQLEEKAVEEQVVEPIQPPAAVELKPTVVVAPKALEPETPKSEEAEPVRPVLKGTSLKTHQAIFAKPYQCDVTFAKFKTLWEHLGGQIISRSTTGSHRALQWNGKTIGGTYAPHGTVQTYGQRCVKDLRQALETIGWGISG